MVEWLRGSHVPASRIALFLSSKDHKAFEQRLTRAAVDAYDPRKHTIDNFVDNQLPSSSGSLLFVYWSGHGVVRQAGQHILLCEDWTKGQTSAILTSLI